MPDNRRIAAEVERLAAPVAAFLGLDIVQVTYRRESHGWVLRLLIERAGEEGGVQVGDCQRLSRELGDVLDVEDPVPTQYRLEVSSPGLDRPLVKPVDFERFSGWRVRRRTTGNAIFPASCAVCARTGSHSTWMDIGSRSNASSWPRPIWCPNSTVSLPARRSDTTGES